ncbi:alpha/beta hydrolase fold [[Actinomadura] parvosata subsp. kistnae]|uniref:Alpha/beta hydrolase n=1 Tax=[Actinomadura] parvosata subsp. kistnae TaxID=1909395 RepID=A0A1U9ZUS8_9ACTN|nr:alpha/beta fold hydrolase [Nonomuraea sp. ATCC 55076]AQZ61705.1 alpha/beta hydrolase [Nonomuraea sp. ATCC 55076]SPL87815.1 alpha/beta hydrolase fold [Actinomadura parvosata subsp. kistnae]
MTFPDTTPHDAAESSVVSLDDGDLHVFRDGPRDAPALLLVHGSASSARSWELMVPLLTGAHHVIRVDLLGHGRSAKPGDRGYGTGDQARRVGEALDRLGVERAVVAGHSSGGVVATALAEQRPGLVTALALINTGPSLDAYLAPQSAAISPAQWPPSDKQLRDFASSGFSRPGYQVPREMLDEVRLMTFHTLTATMQGTTEYLKQGPLPARLAALGKPLLVLFGADDRRWDPASAGDYRVVPGATVELLPGLGHTPIMEDPERTAAPLLAFTARQAGRP